VQRRAWASFVTSPPAQKAAGGADPGMKEVNMTRRQAKRREVGDIIKIDYGRDPQGNWWWREGADVHGPFATEAAARRDSEVVTLGPDCKIIEANMNQQENDVVVTMTPAQIRELSLCLRMFVKELFPRLPDWLHEYERESFDAIRLASRSSPADDKLASLDALTRLMLRVPALEDDDPLGPIFVRSMEFLAQVGLVARRKATPEEMQMIQEKHKLRKAPPASPARH
jgi:hypothetical protein